MNGSAATARARSGTGKGGSGQLAEVARGGALNLVGALVAAVGTTGATLVITHGTSRYVAGSFFTATSAFLIVETVASLGAGTGLVYFIARLRTLGEERRIPVMLRAAFLPVIVISVVLALAMLLFASPLAHFLLSAHTGRGGAQGPLVTALRGLALIIPFAALEDAVLGATRGYREMLPTVVTDRIGVSIAQLLAVAVAALTSTAAFLAPLWALPYVPAAGIAWIWLRRIRRNPTSRRLALPDIPPELAALLALATPLPGSRPSTAGATRSSRTERKRLANANARGFWRFTTPRAAANLSSTIVQRLDIVLVAIIQGPPAAAVYTAATRFLVLGQFAATAINRASQPRLAELFAEDNRRATNVLYGVTTSWLVLLSWPLYLVSMVFGPQVLALFGHSYSAGDTVLLILGASAVFSSAVGQVDVVLITSGRSTWSLLNGLLVLFVNVGLDLILIPKYGITGAAIGWAVAIVVSNVVPLVQLAWVYQLHPFGPACLTAGMVSLVSFGAAPLVLKLIIGGWPALGAGIAVGCVLQAAGMWRFRHTLRLHSMPGMSFLKKARGRGGAAQSLS